MKSAAVNCCAKTARLSATNCAQYAVGFVAPEPSRADYRSLRVEVPGKPELSVRVRKGVTLELRTEYAGRELRP